MTEDTPQETGWRGSREVWLDAALALLVEGGIDAVRIQPLAKRLRIARTSFYWHFTDRDTLLVALAEAWVIRTTTGLVAACAEYADSRAEAMLNVISCFLTDTAFDSRLEHAVRAWALQDATITARLHAEDDTRIAALTALYHRWGVTGVEADTRARAVYLTQIGYISMQVTESLATRMARIPSYVELFTDAAPSARELARFHARHGYPGASVLAAGAAPA
jgi:AcrR family transcriptional regulator